MTALQASGAEAQPALLDTTAVGAMRSRRLHHWDLHAGHGRKHVPRELAHSVGEATLALASRSGGVALDVPRFPVTSADDLLPR